MIEIFYKDNGQMMVSQSEADFATIPYDKVVWILHRFTFFPTL